MTHDRNAPDHNPEFIRRAACDMLDRALEEAEKRGLCGACVLQEMVVLALVNFIESTAEAQNIPKGFALHEIMSDLGGEILAELEAYSGPLDATKH